MFDHTQSDSRIIARVSANVNTVFYKTATASSGGPVRRLAASIVIPDERTHPHHHVA
jgi:hypothetical protein